KPLYSILSYQWAGLDNLGNPQGFVDKEPSSDYTKIFNNLTSPDSLIFNGQSIPKYFGSFGNEISWKKLSFEILLSYSLGYYFRKPATSYSQLFNSGIAYTDIVNRWKQPGDENNTNVPSLPYPANVNRDNFYLGSTATVEKADNIRVQFVNLRYDFTRKGGFLKSFATLKLFINASNLGILWKATDSEFDPDFPAIIRPNRTWIVGVKANF
ncbi:MAG: SusC/RagA family TonB-linked outer membrane protein, partial [Flavobacterium psychrophilum]